MQLSKMVAGLGLAARFILAPEGMALAASPALPAINTNNVLNITSFGAIGDGVTTNTTAIQNAINTATTGGATNGLSGGTVRIPPGIFLSGPLTMKNFVNLQLDPGATLRLLPLSQYPGGDVSPGNFLTGSSLHDLEISGSGGIDGQGAPWWPGYKTNSRPTVIAFSSCTRVLIQNLTISNAPAQNISIKGKAGQVLIQGITVLAPDSAGPTPSHNTDAIDLAETNAIIQNCFLSTGDDNVAMGSSASASADILVTNLLCGYGHGISIGSYTSGGVSNITVINCIFTNTQNGIRIKSDNDRGGRVQNISYLNLGMTNVNFPIQVYAYYNSVGTPNSVTPQLAVAMAATNNAVLSTTPVYRNLTFSNITATTASGYIAGILWPRSELPATNFVFNRVKITSTKSFEVYNSSGIQFLSSTVTPASSASSYLLYHADLTISNPAPVAALNTLDGLTTNGVGNSLALYNAAAALSNTNALADGPLTLGASTLSVSNNLQLYPASVLNFQLSSNPSLVAVYGGLALGGTLNLSSSPGFGPGTNTLLTYTGNLSGSLPTVGTAPTGYTYAFDTVTPGQVKLIVLPPAPPAPTNLLAFASNSLVQLTWASAPAAGSYNLKRATIQAGPFSPLAGALTSTNYTDLSVTNGVTYYYVVSAVNSGGESPPSNLASAVPTPSLAPVALAVQNDAGGMNLSWPADHRGWRLQIQTNDAAAGLGTNWAALIGSELTNQWTVALDPANGTVFLRLTYP